ncbi:MAG: F0F1 ATP synthase subunit B [Patescibacteria group bacterium]
MELLTKLGIDWKLLIAQIVNFLVLMGVLYKFLYKPVLKMLDDRKEKIDQSLKHAEEIEKNLFKSEADKAKVLQEARNEAGKVIAEAKQMSERIREDLENKAKIESASILEQGKKQLALEKEAMFKEIKAEVADMVKAATEKILMNTDENADKKVIGKTLERIK